MTASPTTIPDLSAPVLPVRATPGKRMVQAGDLAAKRRAAVVDVLHPLVFDFSCFTGAIVQEASRYWGRSKMIDLGCGTGRVAMDLLAKMPCLDYVGMDASEPMVWVFRRKAVRLSHPRQTLTFEAPVDLRQRDVVASVAPGGADMILLSQFLQYIPLQSPGQNLHNRVEMLTAARDLTRPGGRLFIIEEVFGENAEEHLTFAVNWDQAIASQVQANFQRLGQVLRNIDPSLVDLLRAKRDHRALAGLMRERAHRQGDRQIVPLSVWCRTFEHLGLRYRAVPHAVLPNFYLFVIAR